MRDEHQSPTVTCGTKDVFSAWAVAAAVIFCLVGISSVQEISRPAYTDRVITEHEPAQVIDVFADDFADEGMVLGWVGWGHSAALIVT